MRIDRYLPDALRTRYSRKLFAVSVSIVLIIVSFSAVVGMQVSDRVTEEQLDSLETNAELEAETLGQWIDGEKASVRILSNHGGIDPTDPEATRATLLAEREEMPEETAHISLVERTPESFSEGTNETIVASTAPEIEGEPLSATNIDWNPERGYNFDSEDDVTLSWVYMDDGDPSVAIASPTPDGEHVIVTEYRTNVRAEQFTSVVDRTETVVLGGFTAFVLFDENKSNVMTRYEGDRENTTVGSLILENDPYTELNGSVLTDETVKGYHSVPSEDVDWVVVKEAPRSSALALTAEVRSDLLILIAMMLVGFGLIGVVIQRGPIRALRRLATRADAISEGDLGVEIRDEGRIDEIGSVRSAFRNTKDYVEIITKQSEALSRQEFDAEVLEAEIPGRVGESLARMRTDLEQFIDEIERERKRYTTLVEQSSDGIVVVRDGRCVFVNDRFVEITGYDRAALVDRQFIDLVVPEDRDLVRERYGKRFRGESPPSQYEIGLESETGERRLVELSVARIDHDGEPAVLVNVRDITERTRLERTYHELFENVADGLIIHDPDTGEIIDVNERFCEMNGYDPSELVGESIGKIVDDDEGYSVEAAQEMIRRAQNEGPQLFEWRNQRKGGDSFPVEVHLRVAHVQGRERVLASIREITDRKRRERAVGALQNATERMQTAGTPEEAVQIAVETASETLDLPLTIGWLHDESERRLDPVAATDPVHDADLVSGLTADRYEYSAFENGEVTSYTPGEHAAENPLRTGVLLPLGEHGLVAAGRRDGVATDDTVLDIAHALAKHTTTALDRIEREREVRESEQRFRLIAERIDEVIYLSSPDFSEVLYVNPAYEEIWGRSVDELYADSTTFLEGVDPRDRESVEADFERMIDEIERGEHRDRYAFEYRVRTPDNEINWVNATGYPVELESGGRQFVGIVEDISDRKRREQRLEVFNRVLRHNLRNQLEVIRSHAEALRERRSGEHAEQILASSDELATISNRARTIDRMLSRERRLSEVDPATVLERTLESIDTADSDVRVTTGLSVSAPLVTDEWILGAVLKSALENAITYADSSVNVTVNESDGGYTFVVGDDGPGIPQDELVALDTGTETHLQHSRGLGLWQLKWGVAELNGEAAFETTDGTTVRITVPGLGGAESV